MDIKLKSSKHKFIISANIILIFIIISAAMYSTYPKIKEAAKKYEYNIFEGSQFLSDIHNITYGIYFDMLTNKENSKLETSDIILNLDKKNTYYMLENSEHYNKIFNQEILSNKENLDDLFSNLEYYAVKKDSNLIQERNQGGINMLLNDNLDERSIEALNNKYSFYIVLDYNENGDRTIKKIYGADKLVATKGFRNNNLRGFNNLELKPIKNMSYVYAVPKELNYTDVIYSYNKNMKSSSYEAAAYNYIIIAFLFIILVGLIIPYKITKEYIGFKKIARIPIEISSFIIFMAIMLICEELSYPIIRSTIDGNLINFSQINVSASVVHALTYSINILYWLICFTIVFTGAIIIKHIFKTGVKQYIKENSLTYKLLRSIGRGNKRAYSYLINIDLKEKNSKKLAAILGINLIILSIISCMWFLGIIAAIIYTVILFVVLRKKYNDLSDKYNKLLEATNKIAKGSLDVTIEEDLGVFNAFKKEIESIQKGFKKAVNEEVKSQKMKTELISNVSHDLKTPLTSIITYVDLLKDENLSPEKHKEYLDTLDRKSQRLKELIEDLFEMSKATSGNINLNLVEVDVVALMKQTLLELEDKISKASLVVKANYPEEKVILHLDSQRMFRVFENLIINITKYAMYGSRVYVDIFSSEDKVEITLKNMTANEIDFDVNDIVERFVRGDKARNTEGSGLGLAIAKSFVELQGGHLNVNVDGDLFKVLIILNK